MSPRVIGLVLAAALIHATWNAMLRSSGDRFKSVVILDIAGGLVALPVIFILPHPVGIGSWTCIFLSAAIHVGYSLFLSYLYQHGELGQVYPIARGSSPLLVAVGGLILAGEHLAPLALAGIMLVSFGIISLSRHKSTKTSTHLLVMAFVTGAMIASYTVTDGIGARLSGHALCYSSWMFVVHAVMMAAIYYVRGGERIRLADPQTLKASLAGLFSIIGYTVIIWAISLSPMGPVSALRETSVVFAALIGRFFLKESLTPQRFAACCVIALGAACLG